MTKKLTLIHAIENKYDHKFERQSKLYLESFGLKNQILLSDIDILFVQPTDNDVLLDTIEFIESHNGSFIKTESNSTQTNENQNFTNNVNAINSVIGSLDTEYICWVDTDIVFLKPFPELLKDTDSIVFSVLPLPEVDTIKEYTSAREIDTATDMDLLYQKYFKDHLPTEYAVDKLEGYVNTWLTYGKRTSGFWEEWQSLTHLLIKILHQHHPDQITLGLESISEELAASILYRANKYTFENLSDFFGSNTTAMICTTDPGLDLTTKCSLLHYRGIMDITMPELQGNFKNDASMILTKMLDKKVITNIDYLSLLKDTL